MKTNITHIRVRYAETDSMKVAYNASYFVWFEVGRNEIMRDLGYPYAQLEAEGFFLPVIEAHCVYIKPIRYDDELELHSAFTEQNGARIRIEYKMFCKTVLVATGYTVHAFTDHEGRPARPPKKFLEKLN
jgi:acyl-CoA thioester hydrolase